MARVVVLSTCGSKSEARLIARELVKRRLAACVNILPVTSFYRWDKKLENESEWLLIIKTRSELFTRVNSRIRKLNKAQVPEIVSLKINDGLTSYLKWLDNETRP